MTAELKSSLVTSLEAAAAQAGLVLLSVTQGADFHGRPTAVFQLGLPGSADGARSLKLELSEAFDFDKPDLLPTMTAHLAAEAKRLRNPRPECYVTLAGLPVAFGQFQWPFHRSTSGADTYIVHGEMHLADGGTHNLHAKIAAIGHADLCRDRARHGAALCGDLRLQRGAQDRRPGPVGVPEVRQPPARAGDHALLQPLAEEVCVYRDQTTRSGCATCCSKVYWLSGVLGEGKPVWIADPRDAQYLNTTEQDLLRMAGDEAGEGLMVLDGEFAAATPALMERAAGVPGRSRSRIQLHQAAVQRVDALRPRKYVASASGFNRAPQAWRSLVV